uniref:Uncharacterized protein n=1 Tax=virus sp. cti5L29 TaxID=2826813 RepID=A0A8S5R8V2_9VIRU|nr:MAG TPA: hypothetical protein [virus sp. cti5L29]
MSNLNITGDLSFSNTKMVDFVKFNQPLSETTTGTTQGIIQYKNTQIIYGFISKDETSSGWSVVTFGKPFADTSYTVLLTWEGNNNDSHAPIVMDRRKTLFQIAHRGGGATGQNCFWLAIGKI